MVPFSSFRVTCYCFRVACSSDAAALSSPHALPLDRPAGAGRRGDPVLHRWRRGQGRGLHRLADHLPPLGHRRDRDLADDPSGARPVDRAPPGGGTGVRVVPHAVRPRQPAHHRGEHDLPPVHRAALPAILAPLLLREPTRRQDLAFMAAVGVGLALFFIGVDRRWRRRPIRCGATCSRWAAASPGRSPSAASAGWPRRARGEARRWSRSWPAT